jgi:hypothetical protein
VYVFFDTLKTSVTFIVLDSSELSFGSKKELG